MNERNAKNVPKKTKIGSVYIICFRFTYPEKCCPFPICVPQSDFEKPAFRFRLIPDLKGLNLSRFIKSDLISVFFQSLLDIFTAVCIYSGKIRFPEKGTERLQTFRKQI